MVILDNLHEINPFIIEKLNGLLDKMYNNDIRHGNIKKFEILENPIKDPIEIDENFRIIGICDINSINKMSPSFLNRFSIIYMENQLKNFKEEDLINLIKILINRNKEISINEKKLMIF